MPERLEAISIPLLPDDSSFQPSELNERMQVAINEVRAILVPKLCLSASTLSFHCELKAGTIYCVGELLISEQLPLHFDGTQEPNSITQSDLGLLSHDGDMLQSAATDAVATIDLVSALVANASRPQKLNDLESIQERSVAEWIMGNSGRQLVLDLVERPHVIDVPILPEYFLDKSQRQITGYVGEIGLNEFMLRRVTDNQAIAQKECLVKRNKMKIHFDQTHVDEGIMLWLGTARTERKSVRITVRAAKGHFSNKIGYYAICSWPNLKRYRKASLRMLGRQHSA